MSNNLPYTLTTGVTATEAGLLIDNRCPLHGYLYQSTVHARPSLDIEVRRQLRLLRWEQAAERLRYREGEPGCFVHDLFPTVITLFHDPDRDRQGFDGAVLDRIVAILVDDGKAFRTLHDCIKDHL